MEPSNQKSSPALPIAIIFGFAMIALAIFITNKNAVTPVIAVNDTQETNTTKEGEPRPVTQTDNIRGNPNAPILMIEYSDYDCPFCSQYNFTMNKIMDEYGITGQLAWVYRQFPIAELHPNSPKISEAALCVGDIGGNEAFWTFSDLIYEKRDDNEMTNVTKLPQYAETAGVSQEKYIECMESGRMKDEVISQIEDGFNSGARGTPYTVLIVGNQQAVINGAQPYDVVKGIVDNLVEQIKGNVDTETIDTSEIPKNENGVPVL
jgi:protein-disulfide isomerase